MMKRHKDSKSFGVRAAKDFKKNYILYILLIPAVVYYIGFHYVPILGNLIAFKNFSPRLGIWGSEWIGIKNFVDFFKDPSFKIVVKNTLTISMSNIIFSFPMPIILALLINELRNKYFIKTVQTITYLPHFVSIVVIAGLIRSFVATEGLITQGLVFFGMKPMNLLNEAKFFVPIYVISDIWQTIGWGSIVYLAALTSIDMELYEAAKIDGAGRFKQTLHITLPCLFPTIIIMLILRLGNVMNVGFEKVMLLYNPLTYVKADVISTYTYRVGMMGMDYGFASAIDIFNSVINCLLLVSANKLSKKMAGNSIY